MQKDFHFYAIYVLCRCNGMSPEHSKTVAYASQHTDDAKHPDALSFEDGGRFQQVLTAHQFFDPKVVHPSSQHRIYVPFHFIPGNQGEKASHKMICRQNSEIAQAIVSEVRNLEDKPYVLHRLGIALHAYADTWSHQDFSGLRVKLNNISRIRYKEGNRWKAGSIIREFIPKIGHAEAKHLPDKPYQEWSFNNRYQKIRERHRQNWKLCLDATKAIYGEIENLLSANSRYRSSDIIPWADVEPVFTDLFIQDGEEPEERCPAWMERINDSEFGFDCQPIERDLKYDDREWFKQAVKVEWAERRNKKVFRKKENFHRSNWKYFHDAAASHQFFVLHELLPQTGIICG